MGERYYPGILGSRRPDGSLQPMKIAYWENDGFSRESTEANSGPTTGDQPIKPKPKPKPRGRSR